MDNTPRGPVSIRVEDQRPGPFGTLLRDLGALLHLGGAAGRPQFDGGDDEAYVPDDARNMNTGWHRERPGGVPRNSREDEALASMMLGRPVAQTWRTGFRTHIPVQIRRGTGELVGDGRTLDVNSGQIFPRGMVRGR